MSSFRVSFIPYLEVPLYVSYFYILTQISIISFILDGGNTVEFTDTEDVESVLSEVVGVVTCICAISQDYFHWERDVGFVCHVLPWTHCPDLHWITLH